MYRPFSGATPPDGYGGLGSPGVLENSSCRAAFPGLLGPVLVVGQQPFSGLDDLLALIAARQHVADVDLRHPSRLRDRLLADPRLLESPFQAC